MLLFIIKGRHSLYRYSFNVNNMMITAVQYFCLDLYKYNSIMSGSLPSVADMCTPAKLYIGISLLLPIVLSVVEVNLTSLLVHIIIVLFWAGLLAYLCDKGFPGISWMLLIIPLGGVFVFLILYMYLLSKATVVRPDTTEIVIVRRN